MMKTIVKVPLISGLIFFLGGPTLGILMTVVSFFTTFRQASASGPQNAEGMATAVSASLFTPLLTIGTGFLGLILLIIALIAHLVTNQSSRKVPDLDDAMK